MTARRKHDDPAAISARLRKTFAEVNHNVKARKAALANGTALVPKPRVVAGSRWAMTPAI